VDELSCCLMTRKGHVTVTMDSSAIYILKITSYFYVRTILDEGQKSIEAVRDATFATSVDSTIIKYLIPVSARCIRNIYKSALTFS
jgi:hypothetical protein